MKKKVLALCFCAFFSVQFLGLTAAAKDATPIPIDLNKIAQDSTLFDTPEGATAEHTIKLAGELECTLTVKTSKESCKTGKDGKTVYQRNANACEKFYVKSKGKSKLMMRCYMDITFTYDKAGNVYVSNPADDIRHGKEITDIDKWALSGNGEILNTTNVCTLSTRWTIYKASGTFGKFEYTDDTHLDIICDSNGVINFNAKGLKDSTEKALHITDQLFHLENGITRENIITKYVYDYGHADNPDAYNYNSINFLSKFYDDGGKLLGEGCFQANFRYSDYFNEAMCLSTYKINSGKVESTSRTANLSRDYGAASGTITLKHSSKTYTQNVILSCDPAGNPGWAIG